MVRQVKVLLAIVVLFCAIGTTAHAASYTTYDGAPSSTYIQYFKDIVSDISLNDNYVAFRSGQNEYILVIGDLEYDGTRFSLKGEGNLYRITNDNSYNGVSDFQVNRISDFTLTTNNRIVYSDCGQYPRLIDRGATYETYTAVILVAFILGISIYKFFFSR